MPEPRVVAQIGALALPSRGHVLRVASVDWGNDFGVGIDGRVLVADAAHDRSVKPVLSLLRVDVAGKEHTTVGSSSPVRRDEGSCCNRERPRSLPSYSGSPVVKAEGDRGSRRDPIRKGGPRQATRGVKPAFASAREARPQARAYGGVRSDAKA
jgi:hypothetical protein